MHPLLVTRLQLEIDGAVVEDKVSTCIVSALVRQALNAPAIAEIVLAEPPKEALPRIRIGASLRITANVGSALFEGEILTVEIERDAAAGRVVRVRAHDKLHRLRKRQQARSLRGQSVADLARAAARDIDVACAVAQGTERDLIVQYDQSDFGLLTTIAADAGLYVVLDDGELRLMTLAGAGEALTLRLGRDLLFARTRASAESLRAGATANAWNVANTAVLSGAATRASQGTADSGHAATFAGLGERILFNRVAGSIGDAQALAQADLDRAGARAASIDATADGNPILRPGCIVEVEDLDGSALGRFTVSSALHRFDPQGGYTTEFSSVPPERTGRPDAPVLTIGRVVTVADPQKWSRVRVSLPLFCDIESTWMPVVIPGAGLNKGFAVLPEPGDQVLVAFPSRDLAHGIVLGGLYGEQNSPGIVDAGTRPFALRTGNGQSFTLDSERGLVRLETSEGDSLELGPGGARLHATHDLTIEAPGKTITIRALAVEFERE